MVYRDLKDLPRRTVSDKVLRHKAFNIAKNPKYDEYQGGIASIFFKFFDKKSSSRGVSSEIMSDQQLAKEFHKPIIRIFEKRKVHPSFKDNTCSAYLANMQLIGKFNKGIIYFMCYWHGFFL